ncbi:formate dehydrogenase accessory sulfurtransferase FdhD [Oceaniferula marina]|nr:formate dehydrogenase accessory sulfurtransferase FdhD [Oceaniferula marina]
MSAGPCGAREEIGLLSESAHARKAGMNQLGKEYELGQGNSSGVEDAVDAVAVEEPLQITVDGTPVAVVMRTPGADRDLVSGFLLSEGLVDSLNQVVNIDLERQLNHAYVFLADDVVLDHHRLSRNLFSASSCGICGKASIEAIHCQAPAMDSDLVVPIEVLLALPERMREAQAGFEHTGGLHAAALFSVEGDLLVLREDVGRHNAIDKVIGAAVAGGIDLSRTLVQVSGRVSFEVMQKALVARVPVVSAISAPSSLAVDFARESGQVLVGFLRPPHFNVYAGRERVKCGT